MASYATSTPVRTSLPQSLIAPTPRVNQELPCCHKIGMRRYFCPAWTLFFLTVFQSCYLYGLHKSLNATDNPVEQIPELNSQPGDVGARGKNPGNTNITVPFSEDVTFKKNRTTSIYVDGPELFIKGCNSTNTHPRMSHLSLAHDLHCDSKDTIKKTLNFFSTAAASGW